MRFLLPFALVAAVAAQNPPTAPPRDGVRTSAAEPTASVSGRVTDAESGRPLADAVVQVVSALSGVIAADSLVRVRAYQAVTGPDGRYALADLPAGDYQVSARPADFTATHRSASLGAPDRLFKLFGKPSLTLEAGDSRANVDIALPRLYGGRPPAPGIDLQYVEMHLSMDSTDAEGIVLLMKRPAQVRGQIAFEGGSPPVGAERLTVTAESRMRGGSAPGQPAPGPVGSDFRFELSDLFGPQIVRVSNLPRGWIVKAVRYRGADVTDLPTEFRTGPDEVEIELTTRAALLTGTVTDASGSPGPSGRVVVFAADPARWHPSVFRSASSIARDGRFSAPPRRAGDYLVVALSAEDYDSLGDAPPFDLLEKLADRVTLFENDRRTIDLRLARLPEEPTADNQGPMPTENPEGANPYESV